MKLKFLHVVILLIFFEEGISAQQFYNQSSAFINANSIWAFPDSAGLNFNGSSIAPIQTSMYGAAKGPGEGCASIADPVTGKLLFYSNGQNCWNADGQLMPNGSGLLGNKGSTKQGVCIVPVIGKENMFYLFSLVDQGTIVVDSAERRDSSQRWPYWGALFYSIVDMNKDGGKGDLIPETKNTPLTEYNRRYSEAMIAVPGNNCDIWLLLHRSDSAIYESYRITTNGLEKNPVISRTTGPNGQFYYIGVGSMSISSDRSRLAFAASIQLVGYSSVAKFDPNTGIVSDEIMLGTLPNKFDPSVYDHGVSCSFSPDNNKLYMIAINANMSQELIQYDIVTHDSAAINFSRTVISPTTHFHLKLYKDTIFLLGLAGAIDLGIIASPNSSGSACNYIPSAIDLLPGTRSISGSLPSDVVYHIPPDTGSMLLIDTLICGSWTKEIMLRPFQIMNGYDYMWNNGSFDTILTIERHGIYWVQYTNGCHTQIDSFVILGEELEKPSIQVKGFELSASGTYDTYQWLLNGEGIPSATERSYYVVENGNYQVAVRNYSGCSDTSNTYNVSNVTAKNFDVVKGITIYPNPTTDVLAIQSTSKIKFTLFDLGGRIMKNEDNVDYIDLSLFPAGIYILEIESDAGQILKMEKIVKY